MKVVYLKIIGIFLIVFSLLYAGFYDFYTEEKNAKRYYLSSEDLRILSNSVVSELGRGVLFEINPIATKRKRPRGQGPKLHHAYLKMNIFGDEIFSDISFDRSLFGNIKNIGTFSVKLSTRRHWKKKYLRSHYEKYFEKVAIGMPSIYAGKQSLDNIFDFRTDYTNFNLITTNKNLKFSYRVYLFMDYKKGAVEQTAKRVYEAQKDLYEMYDVHNISADYAFFDKDRFENETMDDVLFTFVPKSRYLDYYKVSFGAFFRDYHIGTTSLFFEKGHRYNDLEKDPEYVYSIFYYAKKPLEHGWNHKQVRRLSEEEVSDIESNLDWWFNGGGLEENVVELIEIPRKYFWFTNTERDCHPHCKKDYFVPPDGYIMP